VYSEVPEQPVMLPKTESREATYLIIQ
jgi:hypothetical protein